MFLRYVAKILWILHNLFNHDSTDLMMIVKVPKLQIRYL